MSYTKTLLERLNYNTEMVSTQNAIENIKKINPRLNENNYILMAYMSKNPAISQEERDIFKRCMETLVKQETDAYEKTLSNL